MCRYGEHHYKQHFACFDCRLSFKDVWICPLCHKPMALMGRDFQAPRREDVKKWKVLEMLKLRGYSFQSCGCGGPGYRPRTRRALRSFLKHEELLKAAGTRWMPAAPDRRLLYRTRNISRKHKEIK